MQKGRSRRRKRGRSEEGSSDSKGRGGGRQAQPRSLCFTALPFALTPLRPCLLLCLQAVGLLPSLVLTCLCQVSHCHWEDLSVLCWAGSHSCSLKDKQASRHLKEPDEDKVAEEAWAHR